MLNEQVGSLCCTLTRLYREGVKRGERLDTCVHHYHLLFRNLLEGVFFIRAWTPQDLRHHSPVFRAEFGAMGRKESLNVVFIALEG